MTISIDYGDEEATTLKAVDAYLESIQEPRKHLGLSAIGHPCGRYLWFQANGYQVDADPHKAKLLRTFAFGSACEDLMATWLIGAGFNISQRQYKVGFTRDNLVLEGSIDGIISGLIESAKPHLWECKSMNNKGFNAILKGGYEAYKEQYKTQVHVYAYGLKLKRIYVTVLNKDTSEIYSERIKTDNDYAVSQLNRAFDVLEMVVPPDGTCSSEKDFKAKWCDYKALCFEGKKKRA